MVLSHDLTLLGPLSTDLGIEDLHDMIEVILVDAHNTRAIQRIEEEKAKRRSD